MPAPEHIDHGVGAAALVGPSPGDAPIVRRAAELRIVHLHIATQAPRGVHVTEAVPCQPLLRGCVVGRMEANDAKVPTEPRCEDRRFEDREDDTTPLVPPRIIVRGAEDNGRRGRLTGSQHIRARIPEVGEQLRQAGRRRAYVGNGRRVDAIRLEPRAGESG